jgi:hypothetical protein
VRCIDEAWSETMGEVNKLIYYFGYDVSRFLGSELDALKEDLSSEDDETQKLAQEKAIKICDWLFEPLPPVSKQEREEWILQTSKNEALSPAEKVKAISRAVRATGRRRGRPLTDTRQHAILALSLFYATKLSWRKIALIVKGCNHRRPNLERSCESCGDAIRDAAGRLETFLKSLGFSPETERGEIPLADIQASES